jgi:hypothetical protein
MAARLTSWRASAAAACLALVALLGMYTVWSAYHQAREASRNRRPYSSLSPSDRVNYVLGASNASDALRRFRGMLHPGDHFAVILSPAETADRVSFYNSFLPYYFYPAIEVASTSGADAVLVLDPLQHAPQNGFLRIATLGDGIWVERRR